jgi:hypothetical protein
MTPLELVAIVFVVVAVLGLAGYFAYRNFQEPVDKAALEIKKGIDNATDKDVKPNPPAITTSPAPFPAITSLSPSPVYVAPPVYAPPVYAPPVYAPPVYAPPVYAPPVYAPPVYAPPVYAPPVYAPPVYAPPVYAPPVAVPPAVAPPVAVPPVYAPPVAPPAVAPPVAPPAVAPPPVYAPPVAVPPVAVQTVAVPAVAVPPQASWSSGKARYVLGGVGASCTDVCTGAGTSCTNSTQGSETYGWEIAVEALKQSGLQQYSNQDLNNEEWRDNLRVRDGYSYPGGEFRAVPGLWIRGNQAVLNWKNQNHVGTPSQCDTRWGPMMRMCACEK